MATTAVVRRSIHSNWGNVISLYGGDQFIYNQKVWPLPDNVANGPPELKNWFIDQLKMARDVFYTNGVPKGKLKEFLENRNKEILKNCPKGPLSQRMYAVAHTAVMIFIIIASARL